MVGSVCYEVWACEHCVVYHLSQVRLSWLSVATPLVITMVEATTVTTVMVKVMAADHLIGGTELTSDTKPWTDNIFCILFGKKKQPTICFSHSKIHCHKIKAIMQLSTQTAHYGLNRQFAVASTCGWEMFGYGGDPDNDCMLIWFVPCYLSRSKGFTMV